jgi:hypothetical protein
LAAVFALAGPAAAEAPFNFDTAPGRLPKTVVPIDYQVAIAPDAAAKTPSKGPVILSLSKGRVILSSSNIRVILSLSKGDIPAKVEPCRASP